VRADSSPASRTPFLLSPLFLFGCEQRFQPILSINACLNGLMLKIGKLGKDFSDLGRITVSGRQGIEWNLFHESLSNFLVRTL
jgi:hypothetical protein